MEPHAQWRPELIDLGQTEGAFSFEEGFSRPQWQVIGQAIEQRVASSFDLDLAWTKAAHQWLLQLRAELQPRRDHGRAVVRSTG
jgi:hypothetical protein